MITGGDCPDPTFLGRLAAASDVICAADSGLDSIRLAGLSASFVVGDMDSISSEAALEGMDESRIFRFPRDKDHTDTELAVHALTEMRCDSIIVAGGGGGRFDHALALLSLFGSERRLVEWHTAKESMYKVNHELRLEVRLGDTISAFALGDGATGLWSTGLHWPLDGMSWGPRGYGISNRADSTSIRVGLRQGLLMLIAPTWAKKA